MSTLAFSTKTFSPRTRRVRQLLSLLVRSLQVWSGSASGNWRPRFRSSGLQVMRVLTACADLCYHSFQLWLVGRNSNFTLSALRDRIELENLEVSATFRMARSVGMRSSWNLGEVRRTADAMCAAAPHPAREPQDGRSFKARSQFGALEQPMSWPLSSRGLAPPSQVSSSRKKKPVRVGSSVTSARAVRTRPATPSR